MRLSRVKIGFVVILGVLAVMAALPAAALAIDSRITTEALYNQANSYPSGTTVGDGQCFDFGYQVFKAVAQSVGSSALIGGAGTYGYYGCYQQAGGVEVTQDEAQRGDYIQIYDSANPWNDSPTTGAYSVHTAIIQDNLGGGVFNVIDQNFTQPLKVGRHQFNPAKFIADDCGGSPWKVAYWRLGSIGGVPPTLGTSNLLSDASFEQGSSPWKPIAAAGTTVNYCTYNDPSYAHDGDSYLETNTLPAGGSMAQDVAVTTSPGQSYTFSIWLRSHSSTPISGTVSLWGMGGTQEQGHTDFTVGPQWTLVSAPLDVAQAGHTQLRAQIYETTAGANLDLDGAQLVNDGLSDASFEQGSSPWKPIAAAGTTVNYCTYNDPSYAHDGDSYLETNTLPAGGSMAQDVAVTTSPGQSYTFSIWLRSHSSTPISGTVSLWGMGGTQEQGHTDFTVGPQWTLVSAPLDVAQAGHTQLRAQIYETTAGANLDLDGAQLVNDGLSDASFEQGSSPWKPIAAAGTTVNYCTYNDPSYAHDGDSYLETNTLPAGGSMAQDVAVTTSPGQSYTFSIWLRSHSSTPISGTVSLWGMGGTQEQGHTDFTVGPQWTLVSAPLDVAQAGHTQLRAQIYETTAGANLDLDGATFASGGAEMPTPALDTTPPTTKVSGADTLWHNTPVTLTFSATDNPGGSGMSGGSACTEYKVDSGAWTTGTTVTIAAPVSHANDGLRTVNYRSCDAAGNWETAKNVTVKIDTSGPITSARAASGRRAHAIVLHYEVSDALSPTAASVRLVVRNSGGKAVKSWSWASRTVATWYSVRWTPKVKGSYRYYVYGNDLAGNVQASVGHAKIVVR